MSCKLYIQDLRKLGGFWKAYQTAFGCWKYIGVFCGSIWKIQSFSRVDETQWHVYKDGEEIKKSPDPIAYLKLIFIKERDECLRLIYQENEC